MFMMILSALDLAESDGEFALRIYKEYYPIVRYTIRNIIDDKESEEDIIQECFVSLLDKLELLEKLELYKLNSYILITAKRKAYDFNKKRRKKLKIECSSITENGDEIWNNLACESINIEDLLEWKDQHEKVVDILHKLPEKYRDVLLLKYQYAMSDLEIAHQINIKPGNIRMYIKRAREKLIKLIEKEKLYEF